MNKKLFIPAAVFLSACMLGSCSDDNNTPDGGGLTPTESDAKYVGQAVGNFSKEEWYPGGELGTTENISSNCY